MVLITNEGIYTYLTQSAIDKASCILVVLAEGYCWSRTSERQVLRIRYMYLEAILRQEVGFFDSQEATTTEIIESISKDTSLIQEVLSEKVYRSSLFLFLFFLILIRNKCFAFFQLFLLRIR